MNESLKQAFEQKYPNYGRIIDLYGEANDCEPTWESLTKLRLAKFVDYLSETLAPSSVKTYCAMFKAVLSLYNEEYDLPTDYGKILSVKGCIAQNTWLTDDEINRLVKVDTYNDREELIKWQFILGCLTGARHSDYVGFNQSNIVGEKIIYVSQKTHVKIEVPLSPLALTIINEKRAVGKKVADSTFNAVIRKLCKRASIYERVKLFKAGVDVEGEKWEFISSHTARRSFATNVYLHCRDIFLVSRLLGHSSIEMTAKYICTTEIPEELKSYFAEF